MTAYGQALQPQPTPARSKRQQHLTELVRCHAQLLDLLVAQHQQAQALTPPNLRRQAQSLVRRLQRDIQQIEAQLQHLRQPEASLEQRAQKLEAIPGVGTLPRWRCRPNCPNWARSTAGRPPPWPAGSPSAPERRLAGAPHPWGRTGRGAARALHDRPGSGTGQPHAAGLLPAATVGGKPAQVALRAVMRKPVILMQRVLKNPHFVLATYRCC